MLYHLELLISFLSFLSFIAECLSSEVVESYVLSRTSGRVHVKSAECHQHDYDEDRCASIAECYPGTMI
jgi:hypothetical protein